MAREKLTMNKTDVQTAIGETFMKNFSHTKFYGEEIPESIKSITSLIQDREYVGAAKYKVLIEFRGSINKGYCILENEPYKCECYVTIESNEEGEPIVTFEENLIISKNIY